MKNKALMITALGFVIAIMNCIFTIEEKNIRAVDVISIFAGGMMAGVLLTQLFLMLKKPSIEKI